MPDLIDTIVFLKKWTELEIVMTIFYLCYIWDKCLEVCSEPCQKSKLEPFEKIVNGFILHICQGSEYASEPHTFE